MSVRKAHNSGRNHLRNVVDYYQRASCVSRTYCHINILPEIGHEKAQSVIDSITNSYAAEGQSASNPMLGQNPGVAPPPFPGAFPGGSCLPSYCYLHNTLTGSNRRATTLPNPRRASWRATVSISTPRRSWYAHVSVKFSENQSLFHAVSGAAPRRCMHS